MSVEPKVVKMALVDPIEVIHPLLILIPLNHRMKIDSFGKQKIFQFSENYPESGLKNTQLMADDDVVTGFFEANLSTLQPFFRSFPQQWICAVVDRDDKETIVVPETRLVHCKRFELLAIADENSLPELIESYIQQGLISVKNAYPVMRRFDTSLPDVKITGGAKSQLSAGDDSEVTVGDCGCAATGVRGIATAGNHGTATAGDHGTATAGNQSTAIAGRNSSVVVGTYAKAEIISGSVETKEFSLGIVIQNGILSLGKQCLGFIYINPNHPLDKSRFKAGLSSHIRVGLPDKRTVDVVIDGQKYLPDTFYTLNKEGEVVKWKEDSSHPIPTTSFPFELNTNFLAKTGTENDQLVLALDFGTAFSKAVVWNREVGDSGAIDLALGKQTQVFGQTNTNFLFPVASAIFIDDEGRIWFGPDVEESREHLTDAMREEKRSCFKLKVRFNSEHDFPDPFKVDVAKEYNPTDYKIKEWHLMVLYLSYFVDLSVSALKKQHNLDFRYLAIHYVHPCWSSQQKEKWKPFYDLLLTQAQVQAQVLADTLHGRWAEGFTVEQVFPLLEQLREDVKTPSSWLIQKDFDEPVAASADILTFLDQQASTTELKDVRRHLLLVVDAGAGTIDFGLFVIKEWLSDKESSTLTRHIFPFLNSLVALPEAGNRLDDYFKEFLWEQIGTKSSANPSEHAEMERLKRDLKEKFCLQGQLHNELILGHTISVTKQTLKQFNLFKNFEVVFLQALKKSFSALVAADQNSQEWRIGNSFINHEADRAVVHVILTGGSSRFPIIREFFDRKIDAGTLKIESLFYGRKRDIKFIICEPSVQKLNNQTLVKHYQQLATVFGAGHVDMHLERINL